MKGDDVASDTSANSGVIHAGFDAGTRGQWRCSSVLPGGFFLLSRMVPGCVYCRSEGKLDILLEQANKNGAVDCRIVEELLKMEPNLTPNAVAALYAPTKCY